MFEVRRSEPGHKFRSAKHTGGGGRLWGLEWRSQKGNVMPRWEEEGTRAPWYCDDHVSGIGHGPSIASDGGNGGKGKLD